AGQPGHGVHAARPRQPVLLPGGAGQAGRRRRRPDRLLLRRAAEPVWQPERPAAAGRRRPRDPRDERGAAHGPVTARTPAQTGTPATEAPDRRRWRAFAVAVTVASITILDLTKVNVALPSIETALGAASTELQLVVSGYVLTFGLTLVPMGRLGDQRSRRTLFLVGLALFTLTSLVCALATTSTMLLVGRLVQGIAAGIQMPQVLGLVQQLFTGAERGRAFGIF